MQHKPLLQGAAFVFSVFLIAVLAWLTLLEEEDPCADSQTDISAAVLADQPGDQDALVNRAIITNRDCGEKTPKE